MNMFHYHDHLVETTFVWTKYQNTTHSNCFFLKTSLICLNRSSWLFGGHNKRVSVYCFLCFMVSPTWMHKDQNPCLFHPKRKTLMQAKAQVHVHRSAFSFLELVLFWTFALKCYYTRIIVNNGKCLYLPDRFITFDPIDRYWCWV